MHQLRRCAFLVISCVFFLFLSQIAHANVRLTNNPSEDTAPCVDVDSQGIVRVAWSRTIDGRSQIMWQAFTRNGTSVAGPVQITSTASSSTVPNISLDAQDRSFIVWQEGVSTSAKTYFARVEADGSIGIQPRIVNTGNGYDWEPDIATSPDGISNVAVQHTYATFWYMSYRRLDENGDVICGAVPGDFCISPWDKHASIDVDPDGHAVMTWSDYNYLSQGLYAAEYDGNCNRTYRGLRRNANYISSSAVLAPAHGTWHILYQRRIGGVERILEYTGGTDPVISPLPGPSSRVRSAGAAGQSIFAVWADGSSGTNQIKGAHWDASRTLVDDALVISTGPAAATLPAIGTNGLGQYAVVWRDARHAADAAGEIYLEILPPVGLDVTVLSATTENPLPAADVSLFRRGVVQKIQPTDADGLCRFSNLEPGEYTVRASFAGHESPLTAGFVPEEGYGAVQLRIATDIEVVGSLTDAAPLTTGPQDRPLAVRGAAVELVQGETVVAATVSGSTGRFLFNVLNAGDYHCRAVKIGSPIPGEPADTLYAPATSAIVSVPAGAREVEMPTVELDSKVVVMVHGWNSSGNLWSASGFADRLSQRGWTVVSNFNLPGVFLGTHGWAADEEQARYFANVVTDRLDVSSYNVVAHSQGGLVSRYVIEHLRRGTEPRVNKCLTLATPHHGSPLANEVLLLNWFLRPVPAESRFLWFASLWAISQYMQVEYPATRDLQPNSQFLRALNRGSADAHDWGGSCEPGYEPLPEVALDPETSYAVLAGNGFPPILSSRFYLDIFAAYLIDVGCPINDCVVPATSARFYGPGNTHSWLAGAFGLDVHHKRDFSAIPIVHSPAVQDSVANWLARDPSTWPASHDWTAEAKAGPGDWSRVALRQIPALADSVSEESFTIDSCDTLRVSWSWFDGAVDLVLESPDGTVIDSTGAAATPGITYMRDAVEMYGSYLIETPTVGDWTLRMQDVTSDFAQNALVWLEAAAATRLDLIVSPDTPAMFSDHTVAVALKDALGQPVVGAQAVATIVHPSETTEDLTLYDDGQAPDAVAADGIYSATMALETVPGTTVVDVTAIGAQPEPFERRALTSIGRGRLTDVAIADPGLVVADFNGLAGCRVTLNGTAVNYGPLDADLAVSVLAENEMTVLYTDTVSVAVGATVQIETAHLPLAQGEYQYRLRVSPVGDVGEFDWTDNTSTLTVVAASPVSGVQDGGVGPDEPDVAELLQGRSARIVTAFPNPFNPVVNLRCALAKPGRIGLAAYDIRGRLVWEHTSEQLPAGVHEVKWMGRNRYGQDVASGLYFVRMTAGGDHDIRKVMLVR